LKPRAQSSGWTDASPDKGFSASEVVSQARAVADDPLVTDDHRVRQERKLRRFFRTPRKGIDLDIFCYNLSLSAHLAPWLLETKEQVQR
jgi:hypothetical protein